MEIFLFWIGFALIVGLIGKDRKIGFGMAFLWSIILSPLIGLIIVLVSGNKKPKSVAKYRQFNEIAKKAEYKGRYKEAIDKYMDALYHLENDYKGKRLPKQVEFKHRNYIAKLKEKVKQLKEEHPEVIINEE